MVAAWAEYWALIGRGEIVPPEVPDDVHAAEMTAAAADPRPEAFVEIGVLFGDLADDDTFLQEYLACAALARRAGRAPDARRPARPERYRTGAPARRPGPPSAPG